MTQSHMKIYVALALCLLASLPSARAGRVVEDAATIKITELIVLGVSISAAKHSTAVGRN